MTPWVHKNRISVSQSVDRIVELWSRSLQKFTWADRISFLSAISTSIMLTAYNDNRDSTCWSTCTWLHGQKLCKAGRQNTIMLLVASHVDVWLNDLILFVIMVTLHKEPYTLWWYYWRDWSLRNGISIIITFKSKSWIFLILYSTVCWYL